MTVPVRILLLATYSQALSSFVAPLARFLEARGYAVTMAASDEPLIGPATFPQLEAEGFRTRIIPFTNRMRPDRDLVAAWSTYRLARRERFDIVHTFTAKAGFLGRVAARAARVPVVVHTAFSFPHLDTPERAWFYQPMERAATRLSDHVFCISDLGYRQAQSLGVSPRSGISNPGIGLDADRFACLPERAHARAALGLPLAAPLVGTAARLVPHKRIDRFLECCAGIAARRPDVWFLILGDGPERRALEGLCARLQVTNRVRFFLERLTDDQIVSFFRALDVFVLPTEREGFGMVFAEAMAAETPAVAPDAPPMNGIIINGETGYLVEPGNPTAYTQAALRLLGDEDERLRLGRQGRERALTHFDQTRSFAEIEATYRQLLGRG